MKQNISNLVCAPADEGGSGTGAIAQAKQAVSQTARETATRLKTTASQTASRAKEEAQRIAEQKKETVASRVDNYGSALHDSAKSLEEQDPNIAWFTHRAADRLQNVADYVRARDFTALRQDAEGIARRHPAAFFGGMFVAGLVLGSLLTASRRQPSDDSFEESETNDLADSLNRGEAQTETDFPGASAAGI
jgi:hypothetical protein